MANNSQTTLSWLRIYIGVLIAPVFCVIDFLRKCAKEATVWMDSL